VTGLSSFLGSPGLVLALLGAAIGLVVSGFLLLFTPSRRATKE